MSELLLTINIEWNLRLCLRQKIYSWIQIFASPWCMNSGIVCWTKNPHNKQIWTLFTIHLDLEKNLEKSFLIYWLKISNRINARLKKLKETEYKENLIEEILISKLYFQKTNINELFWPRDRKRWRKWSERWR